MSEYEDDADRFAEDVEEYFCAGCNCYLDEEGYCNCYVIETAD